eukprot:TRINITY_DN78728_c0_g1_i1.p1 TRINITY_DN78728_c0_g1~~TRINITY_DN78728_c0_g1_i1.p1  ORF type:complete len:419 (+),score=55.09 TRINITY_DN78728_c0_g1_i1:171-1259(+)
MSDYGKEVHEEVRIMKRVKHSNVAKFHGAFEHQGHFCIALELLGDDLLKVLYREGTPGLPLDIVGIACLQVSRALKYLETVPVIHGDIKPENILTSYGTSWLTRQGRQERSLWQFKIIDFGAAFDRVEISENERITIQTLPYRAPEVLLGLPFRCSADMWSLGCVCAELFIGASLFPHLGEEIEKKEDVIVERMDQLFGPIPTRMLRAGKNTERFFLKELPECRSTAKAEAQMTGWASLQWVTNMFSRFGSGSSQATKKKKGQPRYSLRNSQKKPAPEEGEVTSFEELRKAWEYPKKRFEIFQREAFGFRLGPRRLCQSNLRHQTESRQKLFDLVMSMFKLDPRERLTPVDALSNEFLTDFQ